MCNLSTDIHYSEFNSYMMITIQEKYSVQNFIKICEVICRKTLV